MYCSKCGKEISDTSKFCKNCGNPIEGDINKDTPKSEIGEKSKVIICSDCGQVILRDSVICPHCGNSIEGDIKKVTQSQKGQDIHLNLIITEEESVVGSEKTITFRKENQVTDKITIKIPQGTPSGKVLKISGKGNSGLNGGINGDVYVKIIYDTKTPINSVYNSYCCPSCGSDRITSMGVFKQKTKGYGCLLWIIIFLLCPLLFIIFFGVVGYSIYKIVTEYGFIFIILFIVFTVYYMNNYNNYVCERCGNRFRIKN